ncbi:hypothetical protein AB0H71_31895 [Nocardia sp. NPDC050697]|uniref:hypothetical protein n=1 Tax=Nocardia sp. NPDC050697 TaxID=3155158 RepID=UPI003408B75A
MDDLDFENRVVLVVTHFFGNTVDASQVTDTKLRDCIRFRLHSQHLAESRSERRRHHERIPARYGRSSRDCHSGQLRLDRTRDGDCIEVARLVTTTLRAEGFRADTVAVTGWVTARHFEPALPVGWILPVEDYLRELAHRGPGISHATIDPVDPTSPHPDAEARR